MRLSWDVRPRPSTSVRSGEEVRIVPRPSTERPIDLRLSILGRGRGWLAVDKPPKLPVHPVHDTVENTVIRILRRQEGDPGLRLAHRLDSETSGVLLVASEVESSRRLASSSSCNRSIGPSSQLPRRSIPRSQRRHSRSAWVEAFSQEFSGAMLLSLSYESRLRAEKFRVDGGDEEVVFGPRPAGEFHTTRRAEE